MAETTETDRLNPEQYLGVVRAALDPDERKFFKAYIGQDSPDIGDFLRPTGRFDQARQLREHINRTVLDQAIQQSQAPTVGEQQALFPGSPIPPSAYKTTPQAPLQSMEMPVHQGTQQMQIPDNRTQGPMPGVLTPLGNAAVQWFSASKENPLNREDNEEFSEKGPQFYEEAPRPLRTIDVGQYGPDQAPSQATVMDPMTRLPRSFQSQLGAQQHQISQRQVQPHYPSAEEIKYKQAVELGTMAWLEQHPGQQPKAQDLFQIQQQASGGFEKPPLPGSTKSRIEGSQAIQEEVKADTARPKAQADLEHTKAQTEDLKAKTTETNKLMDAKLGELLSRTELHKSQGNIAAAKAELAEFSAKLRIDERFAKLLHQLVLAGDVDSESKITGLKYLIERSPEFSVHSSDPSWLGGLFGQTSGSGIVIERRQGAGASKAVIPAVPSTGLPAQPQTPAPAPQEDDAGALRALGLSMKDGDVKDYKGQKYRRKGGKLEKVK